MSNQYKFTKPNGGYYEFTVNIEGKTYRQVVYGKTVEEAQCNLDVDNWVVL